MADEYAALYEEEEPPPPPPPPPPTEEPVTQLSPYAALYDPEPQQAAPEPVRESPSAVSVEAARATPDLGPIARNAGEALGETISGLVPKTLGQAGEFITGTFAPAVQAVHDIGTTGQSIYDVLFGGKTIEEANIANRPEAATLAEVEKTPAFSKERFRAGFDVLAQMGMAAAVGRGLQPKGPREVLFPEERPEVPTELTESIVKPAEEVMPDAKQITETAQPNGDVLDAARPEEVAREVPAAEGGARVSEGGQGAEVQEVVKPAEEVTPEVQPAEAPAAREAGVEAFAKEEVAPETAPGEEGVPPEPLAPVPEKMINAVRTPDGKIVGHGVEHGDVISKLSEKFEPTELESGWVIPGKTKGETNATFISTNDVQKFNGDFQAAFDAKLKDAAQKPSKIGKSIEAKAVEAKLTQGFGETAGYDPITISDQAQRATTFIQSAKGDARAVVRGEAPLPEGLRGTSLITAMEEQLLKKPDAQLAYELANSPLTSATSAAAQEMRLMRERVPDSLAAKFQEIREARIEGSKKRGETAERLYRDIQKEVVRQSSKRPTWEAFVRSIEC